MRHAQKYVGATIQTALVTAGSVKVSSRPATPWLSPPRDADARRPDGFSRRVEEARQPRRDGAAQRSVALVRAVLEAALGGAYLRVGEGEGAGVRELRYGEETWVLASRVRG